MFIVTEQAQPFALLSHTSRAKARLVIKDHVETFVLGLSDAEKADPEAVVDMLEGQYGDVLSVDLLDPEGNVASRMYKSMFEAWDLGVPF